MADLSRSAAALRVVGDDLLPDEITALLGVQPTSCGIKGGQRTNASGRGFRVLTGSWIRTVADREPADGDAQVEALLDGLTLDLQIWAGIAARFRIDLFFGLFLAEGNEGFSLAPSTLRLLGERGIRLDLDIYGAGTDE